MMDAFSRAAKKKAMLRIHEHDIDFSPEKTLVIIDVQSLFINEDEIEKTILIEEIIPNIIALIKHAIVKKWAIIVVEYSEFGDTDEEITQALRGYPHKETVTKYGQDGGQEVVECIESHPAWSTNLLVCGIYGPYCVARTVSGLFEHSDVIEVDIIYDAVRPKYESYHGFSQEEKVIMMKDLGILATEGSIV